MNHLQKNNFISHRGHRALRGFKITNKNFSVFSAFSARDNVLNKKDVSLTEPTEFTEVLKKNNKNFSVFSARENWF